MSGSNSLGYNKTEWKKATQGLAIIKAGKRTARITFDEKTNHFEDTGSNIKEFPLDELPSSPVIPTNSEDHYFVKLERKEGMDVEYIGPADGIYPAKPIDFSRPEQESDPAPYEIKPDKFDPYLAFNVYYKINGGDFKGCTVSQFFHYNFEEATDPKMRGYASWQGNPDSPKAKWLPRLIEFCTLFDIVGEPIEWPEDGNVLPELLSRLLASKQAVQIVVKNGYVSDVVASGRSTRIVEAEDDEPAPRSKKAAPATKGKAPAPKSRHGKGETF
jgi:hypothetical protein